IFTSNYGEAGAIDRYGPALGLPPAYSGHNAFGYWGPPPDHAGTVITVGLSRFQLSHFRGCQLAARIDNSAGVNNDEPGETAEQRQERCPGRNRDGDRSFWSSSSGSRPDEPPGGTSHRQLVDADAGWGRTTRGSSCRELEDSWRRVILEQCGPVGTELARLR